MFDLSWTELLVVAGIAIIVVGPKDLPGALRAVGRWTGKAKRMAREFQNQFNDALRETEIDTIKKELESVGKIDPTSDLKENVAEIEANLKGDLDPKILDEPLENPQENEQAVDETMYKPQQSSTDETPTSAASGTKQ